ncbi:MAG: OsmC family protein [Bdellovibrionales bacterium]|nr:OsmC family protein [Bdellovibrionales bacterium]
MAVKLSGTLADAKKCSLTHELSGAVLHTAAPIDNNGDGSSFSPTDLCAGSLVTCMVTIASIWADANDVDLTGTTFSVQKHMSTSPRRIGRLDVTINFPKTVPEDKREKLEAAAKSCPVRQSLKSEIEIPVAFTYTVNS